MTTPLDFMRQRFETKIGRVLTSVPILFEGANAYWMNGQRIASLPENVTHFIRYSFRSAGTTQANFGDVSAQDERTVGVILVQINGPVGTGTKQLEEYAETISAAFRRITHNGVTYRTPSKGTPRRRGKWWALTVRCPVLFYESTAPSEV